MRWKSIQAVGLAILFMLLGSAVAFSKEEKSERRCGTYPGRVLDELAKHRLHVLEREQEIKEGRRKASERGPVSVDVGDITVIQDDGSLITGGRNPFNLKGKSIGFAARPTGGYELTLGTAPLDTSFSNQVPLRDDDSRQVDFTGFSFPYFGTRYNSVFINSDGNLTFGGGDNASSERSLSRFRTGPPRIAGFFNDLNPEQGGKVFADVTSDRVMLTWDRVPEFDAGNANTFQIILFANGDILMAFSSSMDAQEGIVGISPGGTSSEITLIKFASDLPRTILSGAVAETFRIRETMEIDMPALTQAFYGTHSDDYDTLVVFSTPTVDLGDAFAFFLQIKNDVRGLGDLLSDGPGDDLFDLSFEFGSRGRLQGFLNMNQLSVYPDDPRADISLVGGENNTLDVMGQESGHRWGAFLLLNVGGVPTHDLLGRDNAHWSFFTNSDASELEGNEIRDNGDGSFTTVDVTQRFAQIDQYLMGLRPAANVKPFFYVADRSGTAVRPGHAPQRGVTFRGARRDVTIDDIIAANGPRMPDAARSPKTFRQAFILLIGKGETARNADLEKIERIRSSWAQFFPTATDNLGSVDTSLRTTAVPTTFYIPFMEGSAQRYTGIAAANRDTIPATLTFTAYSGNGDLLSISGITNPATLTLAGGEQRALLDAQLFNLALTADRRGWISVSSSSDRVSAFYLSGDLQQNSLDGAVAADRTLTGMVFTRIYEGPGAIFAQEARTQINLVNPGPAATGVTIQYFNAGGSLVATANRTINAQGRLAESFRDLFPALALPVSSGHLEISSTAGLAGVEMVRFGQTEFALPGQERVAAQRLYSAQFASGGVGIFPAPFFTNLKLVNFGDGPAAVRIRIVAENGSLLQAAGVTNPLERSIPARGELSGNAAELFGFPNDGTDSTARLGSVIVEVSSGNVVGDVTFGDALEGRIMAGLPLERRLFTQMIFSQVAEGTSETVSYFSGVAALNPNSRSVELAISVYNEAGRLTGVNFIELRAGQRFSQTLSQIVPGVAGQQRGYVLVNVLAPEGVAIFELFGDTELKRFLAAVPPQAYAFAP